MSGLKLSEFDVADPLDGNELVGLVQNDLNVKAALSDVVLLALGGAVITEVIQDVVGALIAAATGNNSGIVVTYDDTGNAETIGLATSQFQTLTDAATINWNMAVLTGFNAKVTLGGNRALATPTNPLEGRTYTLKIIQDGTGNRTITNWGALNFGEAGEPTLSTGAGKIDLVYIQCLETAGPTFRAVFNKSA